MTVDKVLPLDSPARIGLQAGEKEEMVRRVVHRRTAAMAIRPWNGPLPKVSLPNLTLFDMICPESWIVVKRRKNARQAVARSAPAATAAVTPGKPAIEITTARALCLNSHLGRDGPILSAHA